jgi:hypothetical protein
LCIRMNYHPNGSQLLLHLYIKIKALQLI